ncbi:MAG TPA: hypothetical protein VFT61_07515 [Sphingomicrobium sp.]|jgi:hypothetical protein|nr:hypothetical protein [Sphingomicrobium sp.]
MVEIGSATSRRALLGFITAAPTIAVAVPASPWASPLSRLCEEWNDEPAILRRSNEGRSLSEFRYHNAESFFVSVEKGLVRGRCDLLYRTGIVMQLGISSHLLDVGFDDRWCARHVGLKVAKGLAYSNATGFDCDDADTNLLAAILTPYDKWRNRMMRQRGYDDGPFTAGQIHHLTRALLDRVRDVTGHPR